MNAHKAPSACGSTLCFYCYCTVVAVVVVFVLFQIVLVLGFTMVI